MPRKKQIDAAALMQMIKDGTPESKILSHFGFKTRTQLKLAYLNALVGAGKVKPLNNSRTEAGQADNAINVNKHGRLVIPKAVIDEFGLEEGDLFDVTKTSTGLALYRRRRPIGQA